MINPKQLVEELNPLFNGSLHLSEDGQAVWADRENITSVLKALKERNTCSMLLDITSVDYREYFEMVYHIMTIENADILRLKIKVPVNDPRVMSAVCIWKSADVLEREIYDLMGIEFEEHGNLKRILCCDDFTGNPLRKDFKLDIVSRF